MNIRFLRRTAIFLLVIFSYQLIFPVVSIALTSGPTQPEVHGFEPVGITDMVDLSSGGFSYNIPLLDVGGYPVNMSYHGGVGMDEEASWVGLGWSLTPGAINRNMRGIPDDFNGDLVTKEYSQRDNITVGVGIGGNVQIAGIPLNLGANIGVFNNNYKGPGVEGGLTASTKIGTWAGGSLSGKVGFNSQSGIDVDASAGLSATTNYAGFAATLSGGVNSRQGLKDLTLSANLTYEAPNKNKEASEKASEVAGKDVTVMDRQTTNGPGIGSGSISFSTPTYYPTGDMLFNNESVSFSATLGGEVFAGHPNLSTNGYYTRQSLASNIVTDESYGSLYSTNAQSNTEAVYDLNREKDIPFSKNSVSLAIPYNTFDLFSADGQGVSGQFRLYRNDAGAFGDPYRASLSNGGSLGIEIGIGGWFHGGADVHVNSSTTISQKWTDANGFVPFSRFTAYNNSLYEPSYFKNVGENSPNHNIAFYNRIGGSSKVSVGISSPAAALPSLNGNILSGGNLLKSSREPRNQVFNYLTAGVAKVYALDKNIVSYKYNVRKLSDCISDTEKQIIPRTSNTHHPHHISEVTVTNPDGQRYVYGIPAYNNYEKDVSFRLPESQYHPFSVTGQAKTIPDIISYSPGVDNSVHNKNGQDYFFESDLTPAYSHSFLLTAVLSPDYVDLTGNGISDDDLGTAVKLNYSRTDSNFQWRTPYGTNTANYQEGMNARDNDQRANYVYGSKEIWYVHSIESKTMVALFFLKNRNDGLGVTNENGTKDTTHVHRLQALDHIELYSKADLIQNGNNATPVKVVHFVYNYSLCPGIPNELNNDSGKLTLKEVYFTYGKSNKGQLNGYKFDYGYNPAYSHDNVDRWGNYQEVTGNTPSGKIFPYTCQDSTNKSKFASAWSLNQITLPSGGVININYESNDYAYVQNMRAGQMFFIRGFGHTNIDTTRTTDSSYLLYNGLVATNNYLFVDLPKAVKDTGELRQRYFQDLVDSTIYFSCLVTIDNSYRFNSPYSAYPTKEFIKGYAKYVNYGLLHGNKSCWIQLEPVTSNGAINANPVTISALQTLRLELPEIAYPGSDNNDNDGAASALLKIAGGFFDEIKNMANGFNFTAISQGKCDSVDCNRHSWIRLSNPYYKKYGGGSRVKSITINDNWSAMLDGQEQNFSYGQVYDYTTALSANDTTQISSGVASWEPGIGGEENLFRVPMPYKQTVKLAPSNFYYVEKPLGEALYPAPTVVYSEVKVRNLPHPEVKRTATGYTITKYYTAKDFPTIADNTGLNQVSVNNQSILKFLRFQTHSYITASEGFVVEVNDMHGKMKSQETYNETGALLNGTYYHYQVDNDNAPAKHLNNNVSVALDDGTISSSTIGLDVDMWNDAREQSTNTNSEGVSLNVDVFPIPPFIPAFPLVVPIPSYSKDTKQFRSIATTKFIKRFGILDKVTKMENGSTVSTENLVYDNETGQTLLTKTTNEFDDPLYHLTYPAHWAYDGMGPAYKNIGAVFTKVNTDAKGHFTNLACANAFFVPGDELAVPTNGIIKAAKFYITKPNGRLQVTDENGRPASFNGATITIIRSGRRNMASTAVAELSTRYAPNVNAQFGFVSDNIGNIINSNVIDAKATLYSDQWQTNCFEVRTKICTHDSINWDCAIQFLTDLVAEKKFWTTGSVTIAQLRSNSKFRANSSNYASFFASKGIDTSTAEYSYDAHLSKLTGNFEGKVGNYRLTVIPLNSANWSSFYSGYIPVPDGLVPARGLDSTRIGNADSRGRFASQKYTQHLGAFHLQINVDESYSYLVAIHHDTCFDECVNSLVNDTINPYKYGLMGVWRPKKSYVYYSTRTPDLTASKTNIREQGFIQQFQPFWNYNYLTKTWIPDTTGTNWTWNAEITEYDQKGNEIENRDPLNRYSSALFSYNVSLATAVASNARYRDIANDNFEDYGFSLACDNPCLTSHWNFLDSVSTSCAISDSEAHSGIYSMRLAPSSHITATRDISNNSATAMSLTSDTTMYTLNTGGCIYKFSPDTGKYLLSAWVKEDTLCNCPKYTNNSITIYFTGSALTYTFHPAGPIIDGWQRYEAIFHVPGAATQVKVKLASGTRAVYFDDIRIHPYYGNMKTFVYDPVSLRLMATLDENNYATFYEYDDEGNLIRTKRETEKGVMTIQENRTELRPNN